MLKAITKSYSPELISASLVKINGQVPDCNADPIARFRERVNINYCYGYSSDKIAETADGKIYKRKVRIEDVTRALWIDTLEVVTGKKSKFAICEKNRILYREQAKISKKKFSLYMQQLKELFANQQYFKNADKILETIILLNTLIYENEQNIRLGNLKEKYRIQKESITEYYQIFTKNIKSTRIFIKELSLKYRSVKISKTESKSNRKINLKIISNKAIYIADKIVGFIEGEQNKNEPMFKFLDFLFSQKLTKSEFKNRLYEIYAESDYIKFTNYLKSNIERNEIDLEFDMLTSEEITRFADALEISYRELLEEIKNKNDSRLEEITVQVKNLRERISQSMFKRIECKKEYDHEDLVFKFIHKKYEQCMLNENNGNKKYRKRNLRICKNPHSDCKKQLSAKKVTRLMKIGEEKQENIFNNKVKSIFEYFKNYIFNFGSAKLRNEVKEKMDFWEKATIKKRYGIDFIPESIRGNNYYLLNNSGKIKTQLEKKNERIQSYFSDSINKKQIIDVCALSFYYKKLVKIISEEKKEIVLKNLLYKISIINKCENKSSIAHQLEKINETIKTSKPMFFIRKNNATINAFNEYKINLENTNKEIQTDKSHIINYLLKDENIEKIIFKIIDEASFSAHQIKELMIFIYKNATLIQRKEIIKKLNIIPELIVNALIRLANKRNEETEFEIQERLNSLYQEYIISFFPYEEMRQNNNVFYFSQIAIESLSAIFIRNKCCKNVISDSIREQLRKWGIKDEEIEVISKINQLNLDGKYFLDKNDINEETINEIGMLINRFMSQDNEATEKENFFKAIGDQKIKGEKPLSMIDFCDNYLLSVYHYAKLSFDELADIQHYFVKENMQENLEKAQNKLERALNLFLKTDKNNPARTIEIYISNLEKIDFNDEINLNILNGYSLTEDKLIFLDYFLQIQKNLFEEKAKQSLKINTNMLIEDSVPGEVISIINKIDELKKEWHFLEQSLDKEIQNSREKEIYMIKSEIDKNIVLISGFIFEEEEKLKKLENKRIKIYSKRLDQLKLLRLDLEISVLECNKRYIQKKLKIIEDSRELEYYKHDMQCIIDNIEVKKIIKNNISLRIKDKYFNNQKEDEFKYDNEKIIFNEEEYILFKKQRENFANAIFKHILFEEKIYIKKYKQDMFLQENSYWNQLKNYTDFICQENGLLEKTITFYDLNSNNLSFVNKRSNEIINLYYICLNFGNEKQKERIKFLLWKIQIIQIEEKINFPYPLNIDLSIIGQEFVDFILQIAFDKPYSVNIAYLENCLIKMDSLKNDFDKIEFLSIQKNKSQNLVTTISEIIKNKINDNGWTTAIEKLTNKFGDEKLKQDCNFSLFIKFMQHPNDSIYMNFLNDKLKNTDNLNIFFGEKNIDKITILINNLFSSQHYLQLSEKNIEIIKIIIGKLPNREIKIFDFYILLYQKFCLNQPKDKEINKQLESEYEGNSKNIAYFFAKYKILMTENILLQDIDEKREKRSDEIHLDIVNDLNNFLGLWKDNSITKQNLFDLINDSLDVSFFKMIAYASWLNAQIDKSKIIDDLKKQLNNFNDNSKENKIIALLFIDLISEEKLYDIDTGNHSANAKEKISKLAQAVKFYHIKNLINKLLSSAELLSNDLLYNLIDKFKKLPDSIDLNINLADINSCYACLLYGLIENNQTNIELAYKNIENLYNNSSIPDHKSKIINNCINLLFFCSTSGVNTYLFNDNFRNHELLICKLTQSKLIFLWLEKFLKDGCNFKKIEEKLFFAKNKDICNLVKTLGSFLNFKEKRRLAKLIIEEFKKSYFETNFLQETNSSLAIGINYKFLKLIYSINYAISDKDIKISESIEKLHDINKKISLDFFDSTLKLTKDIICHDDYYLNMNINQFNKMLKFFFDNKKEKIVAICYKIFLAMLFKYFDIVRNGNYNNIERIKIISQYINIFQVYLNPKEILMPKELLFLDKEKISQEYYFEIKNKIINLFDSLKADQRKNLQGSFEYLQTIFSFDDRIIIIFSAFNKQSNLNNYFSDLMYHYSLLKNFMFQENIDNFEKLKSTIFTLPSFIQHSLKELMNFNNIISQNTSQENSKRKEKKFKITEKCIDYLVFNKHNKHDNGQAPKRSLTHTASMLYKIEDKNTKQSIIITLSDIEKVLDKTLFVFNGLTNTEQGVNININALVESVKTRAEIKMQYIIDDATYKKPLDFIDKISSPKYLPICQLFNNLPEVFLELKDKFITQLYCALYESAYACFLNDKSSEDIFSKSLKIYQNIHDKMFTITKKLAIQKEKITNLIERKNLENHAIILAKFKTFLNEYKEETNLQNLEVIKSEIELYLVNLIIAKPKTIKRVLKTIFSAIKDNVIFKNFITEKIMDINNRSSLNVGFNLS